MDGRDFRPIDVLLWFYRHKVYLGICTIVGAILAAGSALIIPKDYHATSILRLNEIISDGNILGAGIAGSSNSLEIIRDVIGGGKRGNETAVTLAYMKSPGFARSFIETYDLLPDLYPKLWDAPRKVWKEPPPSLDHAVGTFRRRVLLNDLDDGLLQLEVVWSSSDRALSIANLLLKSINDVRKRKIISKSIAHLEYLESRIKREPIQEMRTTIAALASNELTKIMLAQGSEEFALQVVDPPYAPEQPIWPRPRLFALLGAIFGFVVSALLLRLIQSLRSAR